MNKAKEFPFYNYTLDKFKEILKRQAENYYHSQAIISEEASRFLSEEEFNRTVLEGLGHQVGQDMLSKYYCENSYGVTKRASVEFYAFSYAELSKLIQSIAERAYFDALQEFGKQSFLDLVKKLEVTNE